MVEPQATTDQPAEGEEFTPGPRLQQRACNGCGAPLTAGLRACAACLERRTGVDERRLSELSRAERYRLEFEAGMAFRRRSERNRSFEYELRRKANRATARAREFGFRDPFERAEQNPVYAAQVASTAYLYPPEFVVRIAMILAAHVQAGRVHAAETCAEPRSPRSPDGTGQDFTAFVAVVLFFGFIGGCFFVAAVLPRVFRIWNRIRSLWRSIAGANVPPELAYPYVGSRTVGVQAQCIYLRKQDKPRFWADTQGFQRGGEVSIDVIFGAGPP